MTDEAATAERPKAKPAAAALAPAGSKGAAAAPAKKAEAPAPLKPLAGGSLHIRESQRNAWWAVAPRGATPTSYDRCPEAWAYVQENLQPGETVQIIFDEGRCQTWAEFLVLRSVAGFAVAHLLREVPLLEAAEDEDAAAIVPAGYRIREGRPDEGLPYVIERLSDAFTMNHGLTFKTRAEAAQWFAQNPIFRQPNSATHYV